VKKKKPRAEADHAKKLNSDPINNPL